MDRSLVDHSRFDGNCRPDRCVRARIDLRTSKTTWEAQKDNVARSSVISVLVRAGVLAVRPLFRFASIRVRVSAGYRSEQGVADKQHV